MVQTILKNSSSHSASSISVGQLEVPIAGPDDGETATVLPTDHVEPMKDDTTKPKKGKKDKRDKARSKRKRKDKNESEGKKNVGKKNVETRDSEWTKTTDEWCRIDTDEHEKTFKCMHIRLGWGDLCKVIALWAVIAGLALSIQVMEKIFPGKKSVIDTEFTTCSLCPAGTSVADPDQEIILGDFQCSAIDSTFESMCFFECENSLSTPRVYTCGEVEQLAKDSSNNCSDGADSCRDFQQADIQCCHETF